jgi:16S rRNA (uracil1498-N3)-methyltransferase
MNLPIFFTHQINETTLSEETSKHIAQVLRMQVGQHIQLTDGKGNLVTALIADNHKKKCVVQHIEKQVFKKPEKEISIAISLVKNASRFEWFLEKATEIGISTIIPLICNRTEKQHFRTERMNGILISAMLQSKQNWLPELKAPTLFKELVESSNHPSKYIAHCESDDQKIQLSSLQKNNQSIILIGPEGDFTPDEIQLAKQNNFLPVTLGDTRLRTETAGMFSAVLLMR